MKIKFSLPIIHEPTDDALVLWITGRNRGNNDVRIMDLSKKGNHGTIIGAVWKNSPLNFPVLSLDGVDDAISIDPVINDIATDTTGTIMFWMKRNSTDAKIVFGFANDTSGVETELFIQADSDIKLIAQLQGDGRQWDFNVPTITQQVWMHITLVHNGTEPNMYINRILATPTYTNSTDKTQWVKRIFTDAAILANVGDIGVLDRNSGFVAPLDGIVDDFRIYNRALLASEISKIYNQTKHLYGK